MSQTKSKRWELASTEHFTQDQEADIIAKTSAIAARAAASVANLSYIRHVVSLLAISFLIIIIVLMMKRD